jgi:N-carbamoyl-L-amino-acid hydrolase
MWRDLAPIGRAAASGGYFRQPFSAAERECRTWFVEQCAVRGLRVAQDGNGNTVGWWEDTADPGLPRVLTGSHLDSVLDGGAYDGPLGIVSAFAAIDLLRERGVRPARAVGVAAFVEEEGSRFGLACLGSRLAVGALSADAARGLRDPDGIGVEDAMSKAGLTPDLGRAGWLSSVGCYLELHVEQGRDLVHREQPVGLASRIWPHGRYRFDFLGEADHAGTTAMADRHDPMLTYAMTALAAAKQARLTGQRATFGRVEVAPGSTNAVPSRVTGWLDVRCEDEEALAALLDAITRQGADRAHRDGTRLEVTAESVSPAVVFDVDLTARLAGLAGGGRPVIPTAAGHDAGVLAAAGIPAAMLFVRNPTGVSHSPAEYAATSDCLAGVEALAAALAELAR